MDFDRDDLQRHFGRIWPVHVDRFTELLVALRRHFHGDLDRMLVLAIIGSRTLHQRRAQGLSYEGFRDGKGIRAEALPTNVQSISDTTGIPRETVRRKVLELEEAGWIERREGGHLVVSGAARTDLAPATEATLQYLVEIVSTCMDAVGQDR